MIEIDKELFSYIERFIQEKCDDNRKLFDLHDILDCKDLNNKLIEDVNLKVKEKCQAFSKKYIEYLTGQKEPDMIFKNALNQQIIDTTLSAESQKVSNILHRVIEANTYFPIDKRIKDGAQKFLDDHKTIYHYCDDEDKKECKRIIKELSDAIFGPCRVLDNNFDKITAILKDDLYRISLYMYRNIRHYIGCDYEAENLLEEMINLKSKLDSNI